MAKFRYSVTCRDCGKIEGDTDDGLYDKATAHRRAGFHEGSRGDECNVLPGLVEEASENPLTGDEWDRYKCDCGHTTVRVPA